MNDPRPHFFGHSSRPPTRAHTPTTFTFFPRLPLELRLKIWFFAIHTPSIIPILSLTSKTSTKPRSPFQPKWITHSRTPALLSTSHESRTEALRFYHRSFGTQLGREIYFSPHSSILLFADCTMIERFFSPNPAKPELDMDSGVVKTVAVVMEDNGEGTLGEWIRERWASRAKGVCGGLEGIVFVHGVRREGEREGDGWRKLRGVEGLVGRVLEMGDGRAGGGAGFVDLDGVEILSVRSEQCGEGRWVL